VFDNRIYEETSPLDEIDEMLEEFESIVTHSKLASRSLLALTGRYSFGGVLVNPYVQLVDDFLAPPKFERRNRYVTNEREITRIQASQASEIYDELIRQKVAPKEALRMLGPLAGEVHGYRISFSFQEVKEGVPITNRRTDAAFMSLS
jgi:hypothetical protein